MKKLFTFLFAAAALIGCSNEEELPGGGNNNGDGMQPGTEIQLPSGTPTNFELYADETTGTLADGISFTTTGPWRATVTDTRTDATTKAASWVTVTPDHGDQAGDYTITITLGVNTSGEDRSATVTIECGTTKLTITIEQKGTTATGEVPDDGDEEPEPEPTPTKLVASIEYVSTEFTQKINYTYDNANRLIRIDGISENKEGGSFQVNFTYGDHTVVYTNTVGDVEEGGRITLDDAGRAVSGEYYGIDKDTETYTGSYQLYYDDAGYLIRTTGDEEEENIEWTNGNPTKVFWGSSTKKMIDKAGYGTIANITNLDLNWLLLDSEGWDFSVGDATKFFALLGYTGKRSAHLAESLVEDRSFGGNPEYRHYEYSIETNDEKMPIAITQTLTQALDITTPYVSAKYTITYTE